MLNSNSNCSRLSLHSRSASESAESSLTVRSSESDSEGSVSISSSSSPFEGGSMSDGCDAEGSETEMKDDEPLSDIVMLGGRSWLKVVWRYVTARVSAVSSRTRSRDLLVQVAEHEIPTLTR